MNSLFPTLVRNPQYPGRIHVPLVQIVLLGGILNLGSLVREHNVTVVDVDNLHAATTDLRF